MRSGRLDRQITIQVRTVTRNSTGEETETWATFYTCFAEREGRGTLERFASDQRYATANAVWRIRWNDDVMATLSPKSHRVTYRDRTYELLGAEEIGRREGVYLLTVARADIEGTP